MEKAKPEKGPAELETARMAAVLNASYPKGWRVRMFWNSGWPTSADEHFRAVVAVERFNGVVWSEFTKLADSGWSEDREIAFAGLLQSWAGRKSWTEDVKYWGGKTVRLPCPPASSTEELCLKLSLLEDAG